MACSWSLRQFLFHGIIAFIMVTTGTINTLAAKWADLNMAGGTNPKAEHYYDHPFFQHKLKTRHWVGMVAIIVGLVVVGYGDYNYFNLHSVAGLSLNTLMAGNLLIVLAQIITAIQFTVEEKILRRHKIQPLQGVGWEGIFGFFTLALLLVPMYFIPWHLPQTSSSWQERKSFEDTIDALYQWGYSPQVLVPSLILVFNIALFNFALLTVTNEKNATTTVVLDNVRSIIIWAISLGVGWQQFEPFQPVGFIIIFVGIWIYYDSIFIPTIKKHIRNFILKCTAIKISDEQKPLFPLPPEVSSA